MRVFRELANRAPERVDQEARRSGGGGRKPWRQKGPAAPSGFDPLSAMGARRRRLRASAVRTSRASTRRNGAPRCAPRCPTSSRPAASSCSTHVARSDEDQGARDAAVRLAEGRQTGRARWCRRELARSAPRCGAPARTAGVAVTHTASSTSRRRRHRAARPHHGCPRRARRQVQQESK